MSDDDAWNEDDDEPIAPPRRSNNTALIIVLVVLGVLGLAVVGGVVLALVGPALWKASFAAPEDAARMQMANIEQAIDLYRLSKKRMPPDLQALTKRAALDDQPILTAIPHDPWGNAYEYEVLGPRRYRLRSLGKDDTADTSDDILWPPDDR